MTYQQGYGCEIKDDDKRIPIFQKQFEERGFDDTELWNLDQTIIQFIYPRLKAFHEGYTCIPDQTAKMLKAFELMYEDIDKTIFDEQRDAIINEGLQEFATWFRALWN